MWTYQAKVVRVVDGDSIYLSVDLGFRIYHTINVRLARINAPELRRGTDEEKQRGRESRSFIEKCLPKGAICIIQTQKSGKYGRWIGEIYTMYNPVQNSAIVAVATQVEGIEGISYNINDFMVASGHAIYQEY